MKQKLLNLFRLRAFALIAILCGVGSTAWGAEEVYKTALFGSDYNSGSIGSYTATWTATNNGFTVDLANFNNNNNSWSYVKCGRKNNASVGTITTASAIDEAITKVVVTIDAITASSVNSIKLYTSSDNDTWTEAGSFTETTGPQTVTLASPKANLYYKVEFDCASGSSNGLVTVSKVEYYYNTSGANAPTISADNLEIAYDATSGAIDYTINNEPSPAGTLTASTTSDWLTLGTVGTTVPFTCSTNGTGAARTATVTLTYTYDTDETVTTDVTVTQTLNPNGSGSQNNPYTVAQARAAIDAGTGTTNVYVTGIISQIDSYNSQYKSITYWISADGTTTDQFEVYSGKGLNEADFSAVTDIVLGAEVVVYGNIKKYNSTYEFDKNNYLVSYTAPAVAVEAPTFSPDAGTYEEAQNVTISCATDGATIYYTTDGTEPTSESTEYTAPIAVSTTTTIKAIAIKGSDESTVATATYHICSADNPYTVAQALAFNEYPANGIYVHGIVSTAPTQAPTNNGEMTYYISDNGEATNQLEVYKGKGLEQAAFTAMDDIQVGDIVTIFGNVQVYNSTIEFGTGNYLVAFERPQSTDPVINAIDVEIDYDATFGEIPYSVDNTVPGTILNASTTADWISNVAVGESEVTFDCTANEGDEDRTATFTLTYGEVTKTVIVTQGHYEVVLDYATLPFEWDDKTTPTGVTNSGVGTYSTSPYLKFDGTGDNIVLKINERPGKLTFDIKGNSFSGGTFTVQVSEDGTTYTDLKSYTALDNNNTQSESINNIGENVRYIKWIYTEKASGNVALGNIALAQYVKPQSYTVSWTEGENIDDIFVFAGDESEAIENGSSVDEGTTVMVSVDVAEGYELEALTVKDAEENDISLTEIEAGVYYSFEMPASNVTITATAKEYVAPTTTSYALATSISPGKRYIIASSADDGAAYAMGEQKNNNRGAGSITIADGVATVASDAGVYEFIIASTEDGYTIYDESYQSTGGYLYAASSSSNNLKTETELDENGNGIWSIDIEEGVATVVAQGTNTRNVMQYNSGSSLFSCYASASQSPVYLFEKVEAPETVPVTIGSAEYATLYYSDKAFEIPEGVTAQIVTSVSDKSIVFEELEDIIPAGTGVVLNGPQGTYDFKVVYVNLAAPENNKLKGFDAPHLTEGGDKFYKLAVKNDKVGFYWGEENGEAFESGAHKAYLALRADEAKEMGYFFDGLVTEIRSIGTETVNGEIYTIGGVRVKADKLQKGIYIVNGKKMVVK